MGIADARSKRLLVGALVLSTLFGCASGSDSEGRLAQDCARQGLTPGTQASAACVEGQQLQQQMELEQIRQAREAARGGTRL